MSYGFDMCFKKVSSFAKAMEYANKFVSTWTKEDVYKLIEDEEYFVPSNRYRLEDNKWKTEIDIGWARNCLSPKFVYFKEQKLLGLLGASWPHRKEFFKDHIYFQNSCDQDYDREDWGNIKYFTDIWDECQNADLDALAESYAKKYNYKKEEVLKEWQIDYEDGIDDKHLDYRRRSMAYDTIYENLHLDSWLWGEEDDDTYVRFAINWINTTERDNDIYMLMKKIEHKN